VTATGTLKVYRAKHVRPALYRADPVLVSALHPGISLDPRLTDMEFDLIQGSFDLALRKTAPKSRFTWYVCNCLRFLAS